MIRPLKELLPLQRISRQRPQERIVQAPSGGGSGTSGRPVTIKFDGSRSGKRYTGHLVNDDGSLGAAVQFRFLNDPGEDGLLDANDYIHAWAIQSWDADNACWSGDDAKYWAILSPWAALG